MSRVKILPDDVKQNCLSLVKGYARRKETYKLRRLDIIRSAPDNIVTIMDPDHPDNKSKGEGVYISGSHYATRTTENISERLMALENDPETKRMRAVEHAAQRIGSDLPAPSRKLLREAIFKSCIQGRRCPFERLNVEGMERSCFYDRRRKFLIDIAKFMEMI